MEHDHVATRDPDHVATRDPDHVATRDPDHVATRDKERTRRAILDAAERLFSERGANVSLAAIAAEAGVTKGGLMHHFPSRDALILGIIEHVTARIWDEVRAQIDLSENTPGKFTRGFVRALTGDSDYVRHMLNPTGLIATLGTSPAIESFYERDAEILNAAFAGDGLPPARVLAVRFAAEGLAIATSTPYLTADELALARAELLALTQVE